ncbi:MAG: penicillin-binding protein [Actinomycetota bacterium]
MTRRGARPALRLLTLLLSLGLGLGGVGYKLVQLQVVHASAFEHIGAKQRIRHFQLPARRGGIFDRNGVPLALSVEARSIYADPRLVIDADETATTLTKLLGVDKDAIKERLKRKSGFVYLARKVDLRVAQRVLALKLPGIGALAETKRIYPQGTLAGQVIGFVGLEGHGLSGIESGFDSQLSGSPGVAVVEQDPRGRPIANGVRNVVNSVRGSDITLTLDRDVQFQAERALADAVAKTGAIEGVALVMDAQNDEVLAMANYPSFDPSQLSGSDADARRNRAVQDSYEPGSVNKLITAAAAIETNTVRPSDVFNVPDQLQVSDKVFHDFETHPTWTIPYTEILAKSSNVGTIEVAQKLGSEKLYDALDRFGLGHRTGIEFPGESPGISLPLDKWSGTSIATIPTGQGIAVTPLQMLNVYTTVARDGVWMAPRLVTRIGESSPPAPKPIHRVVSTFTASQLRAMLLNVVENGTGRSARIPGYLIGGKTGTAKKPFGGRRGYSNNVITTFIGMTPIAKPRFVVGVVLDSPGVHMAAVTAAPAFQRITSFVLARWGVPPQVVPSADARGLHAALGDTPAATVSGARTTFRSTTPRRKKKKKKIIDVPARGVTASPSPSPTRSRHPKASPSPKASPRARPSGWPPAARKQRFAP